MGHFLISLVLKAIELIFGGGLREYYDNNSAKAWYVFLGIAIFMGIAVIIILMYGLIKSMNKEENKYSYKYISKNNDTETYNIKDPFSRPGFSGEKASGSCPMCGYPVVVAKRSYKTGELYFRCASAKKDDGRSCGFKGCRSY